MANQTKTSVSPITEADIDGLQKVLSDLKQGAREAKDKGNLTTFRVYQRLVKVVSPEVVKAHARKERQDLARMNKDSEAMKDTQVHDTSSPYADASSNTP
ncbi:hypothetical protein EPA93_19190 [Ktedonosporobacter rubrisoli]|uniref:Uncharacterized protein n=1 Tax=Ktedonosporobacter rubrisoli TaxID=2509675 RepID=A0A4P6JRS8_KTERU|nr:hypothetical protein [Ktedonosporobacter rubrisoli]QBD78005.1 hypothetical protein EPA93_19190 [Ktedonosporobacter rubrisoli]